MTDFISIYYVTAVYGIHWALGNIIITEVTG